VFRKYAKTLHLSSTKGKRCLSTDEARNLLAGKVYVEEKMDGANVGIIRHAGGISLQKRNSLVGPSEHEQFDFFNNWALYQNYEKLMAVPLNHILYGELLYAVHNIYYDSLPDYVLIFDIWDGHKFLAYPERKALCEMFGLVSAPLVAEGSFTKNQVMKLVPAYSRYGQTCEGVVIKRYAKTAYRKAKVVRPEFIKRLDESEHWSEYQAKKNGTTPIDFMEALNGE